MFETSQYDLFVNQGDDFSVILIVDGLENIHDYTFNFGARYNIANEDLDISSKCEILNDNTILLSLSREVTASLKANDVDFRRNKMYYDVQMVNEDVATRVIEGRIYVSSGNAYKVGDESD